MDMLTSQIISLIKNKKLERWISRIAAICFLLIAICNLPSIFSAYEMLSTTMMYASMFSSYTSSLTVLEDTVYLFQVLIPSISYVIAGLGIFIKKAKVAAIGCLLGVGLSCLCNLCRWMCFINEGFEGIPFTFEWFLIWIPMVMLAFGMLQRKPLPALVYIAGAFFVIIGFWMPIRGFLFGYFSNFEMVTTSLLTGIARIIGGLCACIWIFFKPETKPIGAHLNSPIRKVSKSVSSEQLAEYYELFKEGVISQSDYARIKTLYMGKTELSDDSKESLAEQEGRSIEAKEKPDSCMYAKGNEEERAIKEDKLFSNEAIDESHILEVSGASELAASSIADASLGKEDACAQLSSTAFKGNRFEEEKSLDAFSGAQENGSTKKPRKAALVIVVVAVIAVITVLLVLLLYKSPEAQAREQFEQGNYGEAAQILEKADLENEEARKLLTECHYVLFRQYLQDKYPVKKNLSRGVTIEICAPKTSDDLITVSYTRDLDEGTSTFGYKSLQFSLRRNNPSIDVTGNAKLAYRYVDYFEEHATGKIDASSYTIGQAVKWSTDNVYILGTLMSDDDASELKDITTVTSTCVRTLRDVMDQSATGCTLQDLGLEKI